MEELIESNSDEILEEKSSLQKNKQKSPYFSDSGIFGILSVFAVAFLISLYVFQIFMTPIKIVGSSMQPTLNIQIVSESDEDHSDIVYFHKQKNYDNDDIVIIKNNNLKYVAKNDVNYIVKRVIACPYQTITFYITDQKLDNSSMFFNKIYYYDVKVQDKNGNQIKLDTSYISESNKMRFTEQEYISLQSEGLYPKLQEIYKGLMNNYTESANSYSITLGKDEYFVMGDNRNNSEDSRFFGTVNKNDISGNVLLQVEYGDNIWESIWKKITKN